MNYLNIKQFNNNNFYFYISQNILINNYLYPYAILQIILIRIIFITSFIFTQ